MKKLVINNIMKYIKKRTNYNNQQLLEIEYGITSIYLTISKNEKHKCLKCISA